LIIGPAFDGRRRVICRRMGDRDDSHSCLALPMFQRCVTKRRYADTPMRMAASKLSADTTRKTAACLNRFRSATVSFGRTLMIDPRTDRVLITGAAGEIGTALRDGLRANWHRLRLTDIRPVQNLTDNEEALVADIADRSAIEAMMQDIRAVVHLAGVFGNYDLEALFRVNARGLFDVFEAAPLAGWSASFSPAATTLFLLSHRRGSLAGVAAAA
jgi:NAD dependent epimerase/dehydratase family